MANMLFSVLGLVFAFQWIAVCGGDSLFNASSAFVQEDQVGGGTKWAFLVAGSKGYTNYRHQADVCHAYQVLKRGGLKDDNIIVFMYDDIANSPRNPARGTLINAPNGPDVYKGVPKDYTQGAATLSNFLAVLAGVKGNTRGGSGKVLKTGPNDHIFFYYAGHGSKNKIGFPNGDLITGVTLKLTLMSMHSSRRFKNMLIYIESCYAGTMMVNLPLNIGIFATTSSNQTECSLGDYCWLPKYDKICLGDKYSVSWMEDSDINDPATETLGQQFEKVKKRTNTSTVMRFGDITMYNQRLSEYFGGRGRAP